MHIYFSGIGGTAIGPLALIAHQAGYTVSGSDKQNSQYIEYLKNHGISDISIGQTEKQISTVHAQKPIDWLVYSSAVAIENPSHPELLFAKQQGIKLSKRDEILNEILKKEDLQLIAVAGTHGKTTTTAMMIWLFQQMGQPVSYSVGAKIPFGEMGHFDPSSKYFIYECDEFERNFLAFNPALSLITGIDYDHHEIFPTKEDYVNAFKQFHTQTNKTIFWQSDLDANKIEPDSEDVVISDDAPAINQLTLPGLVNRRDAWQVITAFQEIFQAETSLLVKHMNQFPGLSRRFEKIADRLYTDYAHTIPKIAGCLQMANELSKDVVVVYEPLTNRRQHFIKEDYKDLFTGVKKLYWVPSYLAREDSEQKVLEPADLITYMDNKEIAKAAELNDGLKQAIIEHLHDGDLVVCLSGGGGGSLDEWLRDQFKN